MAVSGTPSLFVSTSHSARNRLDGHHPHGLEPPGENVGVAAVVRQIGNFATSR